jgi:hypothetical protein
MGERRAHTIATYTLAKLWTDSWRQFTTTSSRPKNSVDSPPGKIENRVFIGGNYVLMPILRMIEDTVRQSGFQPIIAVDFDIPLEKTREYTLRLLYQCRLAIFEETLGDGHMVEIARTSGFGEIGFLQIYMAMNERREPPKTMSIMVWQSKPPPEGYLTIDELREIVQAFLARHK